MSETWLLSEIPDAYVTIPGYKIFRRDHGRGGGVCMYVNSSLKINVINLPIPKQPGVEDLWVSVQYHMLPAIIIGCVYRHPKALAASFEYLQDVFSQICLCKKGFYILGDFNDDLLLKGNRLNRIIRSSKLSQLIEEPTRVTPTSASLLDLVITNSPNLVINKDVVPQVIADHDLISIFVNISKPKRKPLMKTFRHLGSYSSDILCTLLLSESYTLNQIMETDDVDLQINIFNDTFIRCLDKCAPVVTREINRPLAPWFNDDLRQAIKKRDDIRNKLKRDRYNLELQHQYTNEKKTVKACIISVKKEYYKKKLTDCRGDSSATWKEIAPSHKNSSNTCEFESQESTTDDAAKFNNFFANIGKNTFNTTQQTLLMNNVSPLDRQPSEYRETTVKFRPKPVDINTLILIIKGLKETKAVGSDGISLKFIKDALCVIAFYLTCIINTSIVTGVFPQAWKHALVIPMFKTGDPNNVHNYRPISLLPIASKILEKIVSNQILLFLETNDFLSKCQHGFRPTLSTESALTTVTNDIFNNMDNKRISLLTLCDLSKAFDSVCHNILLSKCAKLNIESHWLESYLQNRTQSVKLKSVTSTETHVSHGVPQGSILGPILFNIYVNDMADYITECTVVQYADDTQFLHHDTLENLDNIIKATEATLAKVKEYFLRNGLLINPNKTQCIFIGSRQLLPHIPENTVIRFDGISIRPSTHVKNLGLYMDRYMTFDVHINELAKNVMGTLIYISRVSTNFDKSTRRIVVQALVLSLINYCIKIWGTTNSTLLHRVQKLQNFAARVAIGGMKKYDHVSPAFKELNWLKVKQKHLLDISTTMYKSLNKMFPDWLFLFPTVHNATGSTTRQRNNLVVPRTKTASGARALTVHGSKIWNSLPAHITNANTLSCFKSRVTKYLLDSPDG